MVENAVVADGDSSLDDNAVLYGTRLENRGIVREDLKVPAAAEKLVSLLNRYSSREATD